MKIMVSSAKADYRDICHGSSVVVREPLLLKTGYNKDFGFGFYCTIINAEEVKDA